MSYADTEPNIYHDKMLYLVTFTDDDANFYVELNYKLEPLYESKKIDIDKIRECPEFKLNKNHCETKLKVNGETIPVKAQIVKIYPSNWDERSRFYQLLEEQKSKSYLGGKKKIRTNKKSRKNSIVKRRKRRSTVKKNKNKKTNRKY
jgi:hypothetical protein